jgi:coenzyme F420 hydrogenase subunit beta
MTARVVTSVEEIAGGSGLHYLWSPLLSALNEAIFDRGLTRLAVVGPPCVAEGARRLLQADHSRLHPYQDAIRLTIAAFCTGVYMPGLVAEFIEHSQGIARHRIRSISTSAAEGTLTVLEWDGTQHSLPITGVEPYTRRGCATCDDYLGESADLAVGTVGAEPGYATLIARTPVGGACVQNAVRFRLLEVSPQVDEAALDAARAAKDRRARARAFDEFRILMLDALGDPVKRSVVIKQFARLYGSPQAKPTVKEERYVGCGGCS